MSNLKRACRAIQTATGCAYRTAHNKLKAEISSGNRLDESVAKIIDAMNSRHSCAKGGKDLSDSDQCAACHEGRVRA